MPRSRHVTQRTPPPSCTCPQAWSRRACKVCRCQRPLQLSCDQRLQCQDNATATSIRADQSQSGLRPVTLLRSGCDGMANLQPKANDMEKARQKQHEAKQFMLVTQSKHNMLFHSFTLIIADSPFFPILAPRALISVRPQNKYRRTKSVSRYRKSLTNHCEPATF